MYGSAEGFGVVSTDILTLGADLTVPHLGFIELKGYNVPNNVDEIFPFDSILGLAIEGQWPPHPSKPGQPRVNDQFRQMVNKGVLDRNMFSILWPTDTSRAGDIMFGGYNDSLFEGELVSHPIFPEDTTKWTVRVEALYVNRHDCSSAVKRIDTLGHGPALN